MMRRRRRGFSPKWTYANSQTLVASGSSGTNIGSGTGDYCWIYPPARAQFIMNTKQRDRMQFSGAHLWLDFFWKNTGTATGLPDLQFGMYKSDIVSDTGLPDFTPILAQWTEPATPASITSWEEDDDDGTNPLLWSHWIKGMSPPNAETRPITDATDDIKNQSNVLHSGSTDNPAFCCRKFNVTQEWQPDVMVRAKRRLTKGEGIVLVMYLPIGSANLTANLDVHWRALTK